MAEASSSATSGHTNDKASPSADISVNSSIAADPSAVSAGREKRKQQFRNKPRQFYERRSNFDRGKCVTTVPNDVSGTFEDTFKQKVTELREERGKKQMSDAASSDGRITKFPQQFPGKKKTTSTRKARGRGVGVKPSTYIFEHQNSKMTGLKELSDRKVNSYSVNAKAGHGSAAYVLHGSKLTESYGAIRDGVYIRKDKMSSNNKLLNQNLTDYTKKGYDNSKGIRGGSAAPYVLETTYCTTKKSDSGNWRAIDSTGQSSMQGSVLIEQLCNEKYECMVCCEVIKCSKAVWGCSKCYHIFHLFCIKRWARSPTALVEDSEGKAPGWRCPACQFVERSVPNMYKCFCGKVTEPKWHPHDGITPHSCGELCQKRRAGKDCTHQCNQLCHPGPCPSCPVTITKTCCCGKTTIPVRCGKSANVTCSLPCGKILNCGIHSCEEICHLGCCETCVIIQEQKCYCGKTTDKAVCGNVPPVYINGHPGYFSCNEICSKQLKCGNHQCNQICHPSDCKDCALHTDKITHCHCGKKRVEELLDGSNRSSCLDPVPTCEDICGRYLPCAKYNDMTKPSFEHRCKSLCHGADCFSCESESIVKCRCRATSKKLPCVELQVSEEAYLCELKCNKKLDCGRHRCSQKCCPGTEHKCNLICGRRLKCRKHKCTEPCHSGTCPPCLMSGFDEVFCRCGAEVQEPPIPCGKPPPVCYRPCSRMHRCEHEVQHDCHYEDECPPCTILVSKWCMGEHKLRHNIPCHIEDVSCGVKCEKPLPCGKHKCLKTCHKAPCLEENENCKQLCTISREVCGHPCNASCHEGECPEFLCKSKIQIYCKCGRRCEEAVCLKGGDKMEAAQAYQRFTTKHLADKIKGLQGGQSVDISGLMNLNEKREQLECDDVCLVEQRNRSLAEALGISDAATRSESVQYPYFLEEHGKANMKLVCSVEDALENLVKAVAKVQSPSLTHSFTAMNTKNRRFIHEFSTFYGCTSISYDQEPNRNTVVTTTKESRSPRVKLSTHIQRQLNPQPPPPVPVLPDQGIGNIGYTRRKSQERNNVDYFDGDF